jgi:fatty acid desaturase
VASQVLKRVLVWAVVTALAFWLLYWVVAVGIAIIGFIALLVTLLSLDWDAHSTYEQREAERARRRQERYDRTAGKRAKDRARYEAAKAAEERRQARKAGLG